MKYLLDTHVWLWLAFEPERVAVPVRRAIEETSCQGRQADLAEDPRGGEICHNPKNHPRLEKSCGADGT